MPLQFLDLVLAACAALGQILGGVEGDIAPIPTTQPVYPNERREELLNESEEMRQMQAEWRRFWMNNQPSQVPYQVVDGGTGLDAQPPADAKPSSDAKEPLEKLMNQSEGSYPLGYKGELTWGWHYTLETRPSSHMTYQRVDGGIGP
jgi:hypothetical protein